MSWMDLDPVASRNIMDQAVLNPIRPQDPAWYAGAWKAPFTGLASAINDAALLVGDAATPTLRSFARPVDDLFGTNVDDWLIKEQQKAVDNIKGWSPDPQTTGMVGQAVHGLFNVVPEAFGGPETAAILQGYKGYRRGTAEGLDPTTALGVGTLDAVSTWAGMKLPMQVLPRYGIAGALATGAGGNVGLGMLSRGATSQWLDANGYGDMSSQYRVLDSSAIFTDLVLGGGFGALAHYGPAVGQRYADWRNGVGRDVPPSAIDAAHLLNSQLHVETDLAPGIPADTATRAAHVQAVNDAIAALVKDEPVIVRPEVTEGTFVENPQAAESRAQAAMIIEDHLGPEWRELKMELEKRGLPTDEIDTSGAVRIVQEPIKSAAHLSEADLGRLTPEAQGTLRSVYENAERAKPRFDQENAQLAKELGGEYKAAPLKGAARAIDKIVADYKGDAGKIRDVLRASIIVPDPVRAKAAIEQLRARYEVRPEGFRNLFDEGANPIDGYRDAKMIVMVDGVPAEIQVHVPEMIKAKSQLHDLYETRSKLERETEGRQRTDEEQQQIDRLNAAMKADYEAAFAASTSRLKSASETGAPLRLAESAGKGRGGSTSQAAQEGLTPGTLPSETGMPSTSKNSTEAGNFIDFTSEGSLPDLAAVVKNATGDADLGMVLDEHPSLRIPDANGKPVSAAEALAQADAEIASAERESPGFEAAAACALRG